MNHLAAPQQAILLPKGFSFSAVAAGIKASGRRDLALIEAGAGTTAAAVFTTNRVLAAPVVVGRESLAKSGGRVRAVIVNSGNANCATGAAGIQSCRRVCRQAARTLGVRSAEILPSSTGIIGEPFPVDRVLSRLSELTAEGEATERGLRHFAQAIMTTDTRPKIASVGIQTGRMQAAILGVAKGSGMIHPQLATMLVYLCTDIGAHPSELKPLLRAVCQQTFNCISIDGDTSTNDTVLLLASGQSGVRLSQTGVRKKFSAALLKVCHSLAEQIVSDGEGVQHVIRLFVERAKNRDEALRAARAIAHSLLVKTAWAGADPNWGRILAAVGACGAAVVPEHMEIAIGSQVVFRRGAVWPFDPAKAHQELSQSRCDVHVKLGRGRAAVLFHTTDLTADYVRINADYST
jgi:glutamate N-acetyltransferase/amino-acid N-acetyltransferase